MDDYEERLGLLMAGLRQFGGADGDSAAPAGLDARLCDELRAILTEPVNHAVVANLEATANSWATGAANNLTKRNTGLRAQV